MSRKKGKRERRKKERKKQNKTKTNLEHLSPLSGY
jgi:hypothetical protein